MKEFIEISPMDISENVFKLISKDWMLITGKNKDKINTMTASWGGLGEMWGRRVSFIVVRPTRYTFEFIESSDYYTLSFFGDEYRDVLNFCGKYSGRDKDKIKECNLTPISDDETAYFEEAKLVLVCKKLYGQNYDLNNFYNKEFGQKMYPENNIHKMFIGEIQKVLVVK